VFASVEAGQFEQAKAAAGRALDLGVNYVDTAPGYGRSEMVLGRVLSALGRTVVLSTKLGGRPRPFEPKNLDHLRRSLEESLRLLGRDTIDIFLVHEPDRPGQYDWWTEWQDVNGPVLDFLRELKRAGTIRTLGLGGTTVHEMAHLVKSGKFDVVLTAFNYSLLWREAAEPVIKSAKAKGMGVIVGSPLQQGALATRYPAATADSTYWLAPARRAQFRALYALVDECGIPLPELALRFVLSNPNVDCVLTGARSVEEVEQNVAAAERGPLSAEILTRLDAIAAMLPHRPFQEPFGLGGPLANPDRYRGPGIAG